MRRLNKTRGNIGDIERKLSHSNYNHYSLLSSSKAHHLHTRSCSKEKTTIFIQIPPYNPYYQPAYPQPYAQPQHACNPSYPTYEQRAKEEINGMFAHFQAGQEAQR